MQVYQNRNVNTEEATSKAVIDRASDIKDADELYVTVSPNPDGSFIVYLNFKADKIRVGEDSIKSHLSVSCKTANNKTYHTLSRGMDRYIKLDPSLLKYKQHFDLMNYIISEYEPHETAGEDFRSCITRFSNLKWKRGETGEVTSTDLRLPNSAIQVHRFGNKVFCCLGVFGRNFAFEMDYDSDLEMSKNFRIRDIELKFLDAVTHTYAKDYKRWNRQRCAFMSRALNGKHAHLWSGCFDFCETVVEAGGWVHVMQLRGKSRMQLLIDVVAS